MNVLNKAYKGQILLQINVGRTLSLHYWISLSQFYLQITNTCLALILCNYSFCFFLYFSIRFFSFLSFFLPSLSTICIAAIVVGTCHF